MRTYVLALVAVASTAGCHWALNEPGTDPLPAQFYFPTGIVMDPSHRFAYVSNGNADLKYGGGTLQMVDLLRFECAMNSFRAKMGLAVGPAPAECANHGPGSADDWSLDTEAANHYPWCQLDTLDPSIVDCDETPFIVENQTVKLGNFAGEIAMLVDPTNDDGSGNDTMTGARRRLFTAVRGDPSITYVRVDLPPAQQQLSGPSGVPAGSMMNCTDRQPSASGQPGSAASIYDGRAEYDAAKNQLNIPVGCDTRYLVQQDRCDQYPFCFEGTDHKGVAQLPAEPFGLRIDVGPNNLVTDGGTINDGGVTGPQDLYQRLLVAHLATGQVSLLDIGGFPALISSSPAFFTPNATGSHGAYNLAPRVAGDPSSVWYMTSDLFPQLATFAVAQAGLVVPENTVSLQPTFIFGNDIREIEFEAGGNRAFLTDGNPPAVLVFDTHIEATPNGGAPANVVSSVVDVCQEPAHMKVVRSLVAGPPGAPTQVKTTLYVVCFLASQVWMVDPDRGGVDAQIVTGFGGPNQIALNFGDFDAAAPTPTAWDISLPPRGYVTNYLESTVSAIDFDPTSPTFNHVLGRIGFPPDGPQITRGATRPIIPYKQK